MLVKILISNISEINCKLSYCMDTKCNFVSYRLLCGVSNINLVQINISKHSVDCLDHLSRIYLFWRCFFFLNVSRSNFSHLINVNIRIFLVILPSTYLHSHSLKTFSEILRNKASLVHLTILCKKILTRCCLCFLIEN